MKKFTILVAALAISLVTFAQGAITYELNGGVTNDYGWKNKADMFAAFMTDNGATGFETLDYYKAQTDPLGAPNICSKLTTCIAMLNDSAKWNWLKVYIQSVHAIQAGASALDETCTGAAWRYAAGAFFIDGKRASYPVSADFSVAGQVAAFQPTWKHGFVGPTEYAEGDSLVIPAPYKEGYTFIGWYKDEALTEKVDTLTGAGDVKLYAGWVEYIPTIAEVIAMENETETKVQGTVSYVAGSNFWIQDATGGLLCYGKDNGLTEGELVTLAGKKTIYYGSPELANATVVTKEAGTEVGAQTLLLSAIYADSTKAYATYLNELVYLEGVTISQYEDKGSYKTPYITDGFNEIALYNWGDGVTEDKYPVGTKISVKAVLGIYNKNLQLRGQEAWIEAAAAAVKDPYEYPEVEVNGVKHNLVSNWMYSVTLDNWADNRPNPMAEGSRSVVEKDGILYFSYRDNNTPVEQPKLVRVDAKTGKMLEPVVYADSIFKDVKGNWLYGPYTDLKLDNAGNAITSNLPTTGGPFQIWNVDLKTGGGKLLIDLATDTTKWLSAQFPAKDYMQIRLDRIGVYGDINGDATIMSVVAKQDGDSTKASMGKHAIYWDIKDGKWDGKSHILKLGFGTDEDNLGTAPVVCPIEDYYFYVDGFSTYPMLFDPDGQLADAFDEDHEADHLMIGNKGVARAKGHNGVTEFEVNGEYYLIIAGDNTVGDGTAPSTFVLYKFADAERTFKDMTQMWEFPMAGMGSISNPQRVATSFARPNEAGTAVDIYVFTAENGYGAYTMYIGENAPVNVENATINFNIWVENNTIAADVEIEGIFTVTGQNVTALNGNLSAGAYIVRTAEGVAKVMVK